LEERVGDAARCDAVRRGAMRPHSAFSEAAEYQEFLRRAEKGQRTRPERCPEGFRRRGAARSVWDKESGRGRPS